MEPDRIPIKKGIRIRPERLQALIAALQEAERQARQAGLLSAR